MRSKYVFILNYFQRPRAKAHGGGVETTPRRGTTAAWQTDLAPNQHGTEDDLEPIEEVVSYDDDRGASRSPALAGADGFNAGSCSWWDERTVRAAKTEGR